MVVFPLCYKHHNYIHLCVKPINIGIIYSQPLLARNARCVVRLSLNKILSLYLLPCLWKPRGSELFLPISAIDRIRGRWILLPPFSSSFWGFFWFWCRCRINIVSTNLSFKFSSSCLLATIVSTINSVNQSIPWNFSRK